MNDKHMEFMENMERYDLLLTSVSVTIENNTFKAYAKCNCLAVIPWAYRAHFKITVIWK